MMQAIKRVISGEDMQQDSSPTSPSSNNNHQNHPDVVHTRSNSSEDDYDDDGDDGEYELGMEIDDNGNTHGNTSSNNSSRPRPAVVENDMDMMEGASTGDFHIASLSETPRSSLSDMSAAQRVMDDDAMMDEDEDEDDDRPDEQEARKPPINSNSNSNSNSNQHKTMHRNNPGQQAVRNLGNTMASNKDRNSDESSNAGKTGGSQTSSRDWGWFEDVHASDGALAAAAESPGVPKKKGDTYTTSSTNNNTSSNNKRKTSSQQTKSSNSHNNHTRLIHPHQAYREHETLQPINVRDPETESKMQEMFANGGSKDAAAMAVTAPTYVLEESLSSQRLWKDTAGQRPPQPVEERAFFEKMWAQNFARSQVDYQMPVEVLTAATPISLNPFADGNFDAQGGAGNQLSNYNLESSVNEKQGGHHHHGDHTIAGGSKKKQHPSDMAEAALVRKLYEPARGVAQDEEDGHADGSSKKVTTTTTSDGDKMTVQVKGDNVFGTTVSKSFARPSNNGGPIRGVDTVNISVASYRVVDSKKHGKYAQFLVIYREGSIRDTIGVWKRYSDFQELSRKVTQAHEGCATVIANMSPLAVAEEHEVEHLPNAITSWRLLKKRQRWYRCLDAGYLSLKVFLLERFLHDILFESSRPDLLREFVGVPEPRG